MTIGGIALRLLDPADNIETPDRDLTLQLFIGDLASPRARIRLQDLLRQGQRPLHLQRIAGQSIELRLVDPAGWLQSHVLHIEVVLHW